MTTPEPLTPPDCDLRGLEYMPLFGNHLFGSEFNAAVSDSAWRAAMTLWWAAWNQVPAGSLPNDDTALCRLADLGRDLKTWKKLKAGALHGFDLCSDGRLYHSFLCKQALVAWDKRAKERERKAKWRAEQDAKKAGQNADVPRDKNGTGRGQRQGQDADVPADGKRRDGTGRDGTILKPPVASAAVQPAPPPRNARFPMHMGWEPGPDFEQQARYAGMTPEYPWLDDLPEFVLYRMAEGEETTHGQWQIKFIQQIRRNEAYRAQAGNEPTPMHGDWRPDLQTRDAFERTGIDRDFVEDCVAEFVAFWLEVGGHQRSWNAKFIQHVRAQWAKRQPAQRDTFDQLTDTSWFDGSPPEPDLIALPGGGS